MKQIKTIKALEKELLKQEGKKKQLNAAQISELIGCLSDIAFESYNVDSLIVLSDIKKYGVIQIGDVLILNGAKRFLKRSKGKK